MIYNMSAIGNSKYCVQSKEGLFLEATEFVMQ